MKSNESLSTKIIKQFNDYKELIKNNFWKMYDLSFKTRFGW